MWCLYIFVVSVLVTTSAGPVTESYKDQFCTDPRTMQKHAAYTEWADAYSCTRHRCQPGGRNLAIYTVGCKRVEAPESAIECEEVVEDTNMQFPFCCTRLRCLVVVRGEVWTRVLGQPWETLPAAPWSHMYKMKKPPPPNGTLVNKNAGTGPIYELAPDTEASGQKVLRASKKTTGAPDAPDCNDPKPIQVPDIVIALSTEPETKEPKKSDNRHKHRSKTSRALSDEVDKEPRNNEVEFEDAVIITDRTPEASEEKTNSVTRKASNSKSHAAWTEIPQKEWNEQDPSTDTENTFKASPRASDEKQPALQALVDAIGSRMRDIEDVVQRMSQKVSQGKPGESDSGEKRVPDHLSDAEVVPPRSHHKTPDHVTVMKPKQPSPDNEHYKRFTVRNRGSKYLRTTDGPPSEPPLFVEDAHLNGYFSDASNSVLRRVNPPKEPAQYVAPVDTHHKTHILSDGSEETRKHSRRHKKKGKGHKKHHGKDKKKKLRISSAEFDRNTVSLEDNSAIVNL